jgi:hypothetical protein
MTPEDQQLEFDFSNPAQPDQSGFDHWRKEVERADAEEARRLGLPLRRQVEITLYSGATLRGRLELAEPTLFRLDRRSVDLALRVGGSVFTFGQILSCVAVD